ncbi:hypothetical protein TWF281_002389 [Arthrobotrys megalospora]
MKESYQQSNASLPSGETFFTRLRRACLNPATPSKPNIFESGCDTTHQLEIPSIDTQLHPAPSQKTFQCSSCEYSSSHKATLERHVETIHSTTKGVHFCPVQSCRRSKEGFSRLDNLMRHIRGVHPSGTESVEGAKSQEQSLSSESNSGTQEVSETLTECVPIDTPFTEAGDDWCSISNRSWRVDSLIEEVKSQNEDEWEDLGVPRAYIIKRPLARLSIFELQSVLRLANEDALIQFSGEPSFQKGESVKSTIKAMLKAKETAQVMAKLASQVSMDSPAGQLALPSKSPRQAFELLDQKIRETMEPSQGKQISQHKVLHLYETFSEKASSAYEKLVGATRDPENIASLDLKDFISSLVSVENVIEVGCSTLSDFLDQKVPTDLRSIYCMLHVSYAMSQSTTMPEHSHITDTEFSESAATWKEWLPIVSDSGVPEQDVFDELLRIMWSEMKGGLEIITEWLDILTREQATSEAPKEFDPSLPTAGIYDIDPVYPTLVEDYQESLPTIDFLDAFYITEVAAAQQDYNLQLPLTPVEVAPEPLIPLPWESLVHSLAITTALAFLQELKAAGILFFHLFGSLGTLLASRFYSSKDVLPKQSNARPLNIRERQTIAKSMQQSLNRLTYPHASIIVPTVSSLFLEGYIAGLDDLEECMVAFLSILCQPSDPSLRFFSAIIMYLNTYYHAELPAEAKRPRDRYNDLSYVLSRVTEETEALFLVDCRDSTAMSSPSSDATSQSQPRHSARPGPQKRGNSEAGVEQPAGRTGKKSKVNRGATNPGEATAPKVFKFKVEIGDPTAKKRRRVLPNLPHV